MKVNPIYRSLLDKSIASMISAIEIYNKPDFQYREESFVILSVNAWELLFKAHLLKLAKYRIRDIYELEPVKLHNGKDAKNRKQPKLNRTGNPKTIDIFVTMRRLEEYKLLPSNLKKNVEDLVEMRDNSVHFYSDALESVVQELGFACVKNYVEILKLWHVPIDLSKYHFYLMPLAYIDKHKFVQGVLTDAEKNYLNLLKDHVAHADAVDDKFDITVSVEIDFKKHNSLEALGVKYDTNGVPINLTDEEISQRFPLSYRQIQQQCSERYSDFKSNKDFNQHMTEVKRNSKIAHKRSLNPKNPKSPQTTIYNGGVFAVLDRYYTKKE